LEGQKTGAAAKITDGLAPRDERIIARFEEIHRFVEEHGRLPQNGEEKKSSSGSTQHD
jgi:hypothetical protein